jgi:hypothetical protein
MQRGKFTNKCLHYVCTFCERPSQSCVVRVTSTLLYTLNLLVHGFGRARKHVDEWARWRWHVARHQKTCACMHLGGMAGGLDARLGRGG